MMMMMMTTTMMMTMTMMMMMTEAASIKEVKSEGSEEQEADILDLQDLQDPGGLQDPLPPSCPISRTSSKTWEVGASHTRQSPCSPAPWREGSCNT
ncbi:hypothetical protein EYF80_066999 [Liparis tanakae]|uniref:Uncharacterized protein n=1 Tax=Liparis tanakae TaxID=230148 RepID=A0A4Z2E278_9TELE|nr:hypothetical protein EYF80_066999 [Liparis tanakae]